MIGKTVSHYRIVEKLGEGGMGEVYLAEDTELERKVALKFLPQQAAYDPEALARFKREAQAAAALNHPNIITVYEVGRHEDQSFIAMAYVDGEPLSDELQRGVTLERALEIAMQACDGLDKAHRAGIVHRDVKPENMLIDSDGRVKILDFGIATFGKSGGAASSESTGGTAHYMSPEQVRGEAVDARSDVFSMGAVLYEMIAGKRPFKGVHSEAVRYSVLNENPEPLSKVKPGVPPELERVVLKAMSKNPDDRYPSAAELGADLEALYSRSAAAERGKFPKRLAIPGVIVLVAAAVFLLINPFKVKISSEQDAVAGQNTIAIMYFENLAQKEDPQRLGEIITNLLITNLTQTPGLKVVSSQRLYDILKIKGREGAKVIDRTTATEIAKTAGARWMVLGSILQVEPHLVVTSQLIDVESGNVENSHRLTGAPGETVFELVDRMTGEAITNLALSTPKGAEQPRPVVDVTTDDLNAYRHYVEGLEYEYKYYYLDACEHFREATEIDPTFAMAHYRYAVNAFRAGRLRAGQAALEEAMKHAVHASEKERLFIEALAANWENNENEAIAKWKQIADMYPDEKEAFSSLASQYQGRGEYDLSLKYYEKVLAIDPFHKQTYNSLAYLYDQKGEFDKSIAAINRYIELAPDEANPYDTRADLYAFHGDIDNAIASYQKAVEIKPDYQASLVKLGNMFLFKRQYDQAEAVYRKLLDSEDPSVRSRGRSYPAGVKWYQGRLREAMEALEIAISADKTEGYRAEQHLQKFNMRSSIYTDLKQFERALTEARIRFEILKQLFPRYSAQLDVELASVCADNGDLSQAESLIGFYEPVVDTLSHKTQSLYYRAKAKIVLKNGDPKSAAALCERAAKLAPDDFITRYDLAAAYMRDDRVGEAITVLEKALSRYDESRLTLPYLAARAYYALGCAYQMAQKNDEAVEQLQSFLRICGDADAELDEVPDARKRLEELKRGS